MAEDKGRRRLTVVIVAAVLLSAAGALLLGLGRHRREAAERAQLARVADAGPEVRVARVQAGPGEREVVLPADVRAFWQTTLYAKVNGYVEDLHVDKGDRVRKGDVLARISSPETDQQVRQARSTFVNRRRIAQRVRSLGGSGAVSREEFDQANADLAVAEAELRRVLALQEYEVLRAPFDGVITARYVDPGALLSASGAGQPVVDLADPTRTRVQLYVGQDVAPFVRLGDPGEITVDQHPDLRVGATVRRVADALDARTRSMLVELWPEEGTAFRLVPGMFVHASLRVRVAEPALGAGGGARRTRREAAGRTRRGQPAPLRRRGAGAERREDDPDPARARARGDGGALAAVRPRGRRAGAAARGAAARRGPASGADGTTREQPPGTAGSAGASRARSTQRRRAERRRRPRYGPAMRARATRSRNDS